MLYFWNYFYLSCIVIFWGQAGSYIYVIYVWRPKFQIKKQWVTLLVHILGGPDSLYFALTNNTHRVLVSIRVAHSLPSIYVVSSRQAIIALLTFTLAREHPITTAGPLLNIE